MATLLPTESTSASCPPRSAQWILQGTSHADGVGLSEARLGNVNNDSFGDVILGASGFNGNQGMAQIFLGSANGLSHGPFLDRFRRRAWRLWTKGWRQPGM